MPTQIEGIDPVAVGQGRSNTHPALSGTGDTVQQDHARKVSALSPPASIMEATGRQVNHLRLGSCLKVLHHGSLLISAFCDVSSLLLCHNALPRYLVGGGGLPH